ncbi:MAG: ThuA domain-containing protein [Verrucomicrobiales bacterium]
MTCKTTTFTTWLFIAASLISAGAKDTVTPPQEKIYSGKKLKILLITGGCCHNYIFQSTALTAGIEQQVNAEFTVINEGGKGTRAKIPFYDDPKWADPYDVVIHNECFADTTDTGYIRKITAVHKAGKPALVIHCAMHTYRSAKIDDWRQFLGVTSRRHEHKSNYAVISSLKDHPVMKGFPDKWITPKDELYVIDKTWPDTKPLAYSTSEKTGKKHAVIWINKYGTARVFGTTYGHSDDTFRDKVFINLLARATAWVAGKL